LVISKRWRPITIDPMLVHIGSTYAAEACDTLSVPPGVSNNSMSPLTYQSNSGPT
jgi:hypothetical protein